MNERFSKKMDSAVRPTPVADPFDPPVSNHCVLLYVSDLVRSVKPDAIAHIARHSRRNNQRDNITGLLVFDGAIFAQWVEGPKAVLTGLLSRLRNDSRHENIQVLFFDQVSPGRNFPHWRLGYYVLDDAPDGISGLRGTCGTAAVSYFASLIRDLDLLATEPSTFQE